MNNYFFENPVGTNRVSLVVSDRSIEDLKEAEIIPKESKVIVKPYNSNPKADEFAFSSHVDKLRIDGDNLVFDLEVLSIWFLDEYRKIREQAFKLLDNYEVRAMVSKRDDILVLIEKDKELLRNLTDDLNLSDCKTPKEIANKVPFALAVDYDTKYKDMFKS